MASLVITLRAPDVFPILPASVIPTLQPATTPTCAANPVSLTVTGATAGATIRIYDTDGVTVVGSGTASSGTTSIPCTLGEGAHTLTATAHEPAHDESAPSSSMLLVVDRTAPSVSLSATPPAAGELTAAIAVTSSGATGFIVKESPAAPAPTDTWGAAPTQFTFSTYGQRTLYAWARDAAGNVSSPASVSVLLRRSLLQQADRVATKRIWFGHMSIGESLMGMLRGLIANEIPTTVLREISIARPNYIGPVDGSQIRLPSPSWGDSYNGNTNEGPGRGIQSKADHFEEAIRNSVGARVDWAWHKAGFPDVYAGVDVVAAYAYYRSKMLKLEVDYPALRLFHGTITPVASGSTYPDNPASGNQYREQFNDFMRSDFGANPDPAKRRTVLDFADWCCLGADGRRAYCTLDGTGLYYDDPVGHVRCLAPEWSADGGHLVNAGQDHVVRQLMLALDQALDTVPPALRMRLAGAMLTSGSAGLVGAGTAIADSPVLGPNGVPGVQRMSLGEQSTSFWYSSFDKTTGASHRIEAWMRADVPLSLYLTVQTGDTYRTLRCNLTSTWQHFQLDFTAAAGNHYANLGRDQAHAFGQDVLTGAGNFDVFDLRVSQLG